MTVLRYLLAALVCYLISNINPAIILSNLIYHKDIRGFGSGNAGTTNSFRVFGPQIGIPVMLFDIGKGALSVYLGGVLLLGGAWYCIAYAGFFAVLGHVYPVAFGFRGGKGVATIAGMLIVLDWRVFLGSLAGFLVVLAIGRVMSVASMSCIVFAPASVYVFSCLVDGRPFSDVWPKMLVAFFFGAILLFTHRDNIRRLFRGKESRIGRIKKS